MELVSPDVEAQTKQALNNMGEILKCAGLSFSNVVKTTVLLKDINDFVKVNDIYKTFFHVQLSRKSSVPGCSVAEGRRRRDRGRRPRCQFHQGRSHRAEMSPATHSSLPKNSICLINDFCGSGKLNFLTRSSR